MSPPAITRALAERQPSQELLIRAAFVAKLPLFIREAADAQSPSAETAVVTIAVLGDEEMYGALLDLARFPFVEGHSIQVRLLNNLEEHRKGEILYFPSSGRRSLAAALELSRSNRTIVITDSIALCEKGIMFAIAQDHSRMKIFVNRQAVDDAGLMLDYRVATFARFIEP